MGSSGLWSLVGIVGSEAVHVSRGRLLCEPQDFVPVNVSLLTGSFNIYLRRLWLR